MYKLKSIKIDGIHNVYKETKYDFGDITHIFGSNGSGKTTILQSIQFGILGYIPGTNKKNPDIFKHCNNNMEMSVSLELYGDGIVYIINRSLGRSGKTIEEKLTVNPILDLSEIISDLELPIFNFDDFYNLTPNKMKSWFMEFLPSNDKTIDWDFELKSSLDKSGLYFGDEFTNGLVKRYIDDLVSFDKNNNILDAIKYSNDFFKSELKLKKEEMNRLVGAIQSMVYYDDDELLDYDLVDLENKLNALNIKRDVAKRYIENKLLNSKQLAEIESFKSNLESKYDISFSSDEHPIEKLNFLLNSKKLEFSKYEEDYLNQIESDKEFITELKNLRQNLERDLKLYEFSKSDNNRCPILGNLCEFLSEAKVSGLEKYNSIDFRLKETRKRLFELEDKIYSEKEKYDKFKSYINNLDSDIDKFTYLFNSIQSLSNNDGEEYDDAFVLNLDNQIKDTEDIILKIKVNNEYEKLSERMMSDKFDLENEIECIKTWVKHTDVNNMQTTYSSGDGFNVLKDNMNTLLKDLFADNIKAHFVVSTKSNDFAFGIIEDDNYFIPYQLLSSGEKCLYSMALFTALCMMSDSKLKLVIVDDMIDHLDVENRDKLFDIISNYKGVQYIFASVFGSSENKTGITEIMF